MLLPLLYDKKEETFMVTATKKPFKWRGVATFMLVMALLVEIISGVVLYITPPGRYAHWTNWTLWGLSKEGWGTMHTIFGYLLLIIIAGHLYYNWKVIVAFVWSKVRHTFNLKRELAVATVITLAVFLGTVWNVAPFSTVMNFGEKAKHSWEQKDPTYARGRGRGITSSRLALSNEDGRHTPNSRSGYAQPSVPLITDSKGNGARGKRRNAFSPAIAHAETMPSVQRGGLGRRTLDMVFSEYGIPVHEGLSRLKSQGIEVKATDTVRDLADKSGKRPSEIIGMATGKAASGRGSYAMVQDDTISYRGRGRRAASQGFGLRNPTPSFDSAPYSGTSGKQSYLSDTAGSKLKGRDLVQLGKIATLTGTLEQHGDEWGLKVGTTSYEIHLGPADYRTNQGLVLNNGGQATVKGFVYGTDVAVMEIEAGGKKITLRDETGHPAWAGSKFSMTARSKSNQPTRAW
jgi:hypothetical protein